MVLPRIPMLDRFERGLTDVKGRRGGMFQYGKLLEVNADGAASVMLEGRFGQARASGLSSLVDEPEHLVGLKVVCLFPSGQPSDGGFVLGAFGPVTALADFTVLAPAPDTLEARDRVALADTLAWTGEAFVPAGITVVITSVVLIVDSITEGTPVMSMGATHFREVSRDSVRFVLAPAQPFRADDSFGLSLSVDRTGLSDAVLQVPYSTEAQPSKQRLKFKTKTGAGFPYMVLRGRLN